MINLEWQRASSNTVPGITPYRGWHCIAVHLMQLLRATHQDPAVIKLQPNLWKSTTRRDWRVRNWRAIKIPKCLPYLTAGLFIDRAIHCFDMTTTDKPRHGCFRMQEGIWSKHQHITMLWEIGYRIFLRVYQASFFYLPLMSVHQMSARKRRLHIHTNADAFKISTWAMAVLKINRELGMLLMQRYRTVSV